MTLRVQPTARADLRSIARYIAQDNPLAAQEWTETIIAKCERIAEMPGIGVARREVDPTLRVFPVGKYVIFYRHIDSTTEIVRVLHGARDWQSLL